MLCPCSLGAAGLLLTNISPPCLGCREEGALSPAVFTFKSNCSDTASALFPTVFPSFSS